MSTQQLGVLIQSLGQLKAEKKSLDADLEILADKIKETETDIMSALDADGITESGSDAGKVTMSTSIYPNLAEWAQLESHIFETRSLVLLEKRIAVTPYREMLSLRREVPGVVPFHKRKLTYRAKADD